MTSKINLKFMDQIGYLEGFHRSGWPYVLKSLLTLHDDSGIWCDTYVDRTFHWYKPNFIPYSRPWIGFVHHTFDSTFSNYNNQTLLQNEDFKSSLTHCKGLFVFTKDLQTRWMTELHNLGFNVPVVALYHPTQFVSQTFTLEKFNDNPKKYLVQIGAWLRDNYAIYKLNAGNGTIMVQGDGNVRKAALKGYNMDHYFRPVNFFRAFRKPSWKRDNIIPPLLSSTETNIAPTEGESLRIVSVNGELPSSVLVTPEEDFDDGICRDIVCRDSEYALNKYVIGAVKLLENYDGSVVVIPLLADTDYDGLIDKNIVFMQLIDAGAVNTVIECIVRNTPLVVNRIPPVEEYLGSDYPLYFDVKKDDISKVLTLDNITKSFDYLSSMDKTFLTRDRFLSDFTSSRVYQSL